MFENEKQTQLFELFWGKYPYLHLTFKFENMKFTYETNMNENLFKSVKYVEHDFKEEIQDEILNNEQLNILHNISNENFK